jgi:hypothetical protein
VVVVGRNELSGFMACRLRRDQAPDDEQQRRENEKKSEDGRNM